MDVSCSEVLKKEDLKRKRSSNWIEEDKILLKELVKERVAEIENKNTDTNTNQRKKKAWCELEESFNNLCKGSTRSLPQLKSQWTMTKIQAKKEVASHRREVNKTGGGPQPTEIVLSENDITVWLPNEFIVDTNEFDSDLVSEISPAVQIASPTNKKEEEPKSDSEVKEILASKPLGRKKKMRPVETRKVADKKITEVVGFDIQCRKELHQLQVENLQRESQHRDEMHQLQIINEEKKARNLDLQYRILKEKYEDTQLFKSKQIDDVERLKPQKRGFFQSILCCWRRNRTKTNQNGTPIDGSTTPPPLPDQQRYLLPQVRHSDMHKKCMVIDLDETLVHSSFKPIPNADFIVPVEIDGTIHQVYVLKRPYVDEFLRKMGELYECVLFTASLAKYADPVADLLDKWNVFRARLFRESCVYYRGNYIKDLNRLGRDLQKIVIVDNSPASYIFHPDNAVPVKSWFDDASDCELLELIPLFEKLSKVDSVYSVLCNSNNPLNNHNQQQQQQPQNQQQLQPTPQHQMNQQQQQQTITATTIITQASTLSTPTILTSQQPQQQQQPASPPNSNDLNNKT